MTGVHFEKPKKVISGSVGISDGYNQQLTMEDVIEWDGYLDMGREILDFLYHPNGSIRIHTNVEYSDMLVKLHKMCLANSAKL